MRSAPYDVYIGRGSKWGNPYGTREDSKARHIVGSREEAIVCYEKYLFGSAELFGTLHELRGKTLGCYCKPKPCHGDVLVRLVNELEG